MLKIFDSTIDVRLRQFYILALAGCTGNLAGFLSNLIIYGLTLPTVICGICNILIIIASFIGIKGHHILTASYFIVILLVFFEFPFLYYIYQTGTIVYMILGIVSIAAFIPGRFSILLAALAVICDTCLVIFTYYYPSTWFVINRFDAFSSTICSLFIVLVSTFLITFLLYQQQKRQSEQLNELSNRLKYAADHDPLTGLYNRRYLNRYIEDLIACETKDFYAIILDLDFFKKINDSFGHSFGDEVLIQFAGILTRHAVGHGIVSRFGGEEFMIIFSGINKEDIKSILDTARSDYRTFIKERKGVDFSFSSGVIKYSKGMNISTIYTLADEKLYYAKQHNRNMDVF